MQLLSKLNVTHAGLSSYPANAHNLSETTDHGTMSNGSNQDRGRKERIICS